MIRTSRRVSVFRHWIPSSDRYGWVILVAGTVGVLASIPGQTAGVAAFTSPLIEDLQLSRVQLSVAYLVGTIGSALCLAWAGRLYDRHGARWMACAAGLGLGLVLVSLSQSPRLLNLAAQSVPAPAAAFVIVTFGFFGVRFCGQGALTMASRNMVMKWFEKRRGFANGVTGVAVAFGFSYAPQALHQAIEAIGWRRTWLGLGVAIGVGFALFAWALFRDDPRDYGLEPDAGMAGPTRLPQAPTGPARDATLPEARRSWAFWTYALSLSLFALYMTAFTFHVESVFAESGMPAAEAFAIFLPTAAVTVFVQLAGGIVTDYTRLHRILLAELVGLMLAMTGLLALGPGWRKLLLIAGNGICGGLFGVLLGVAWPRLFGLRHLGAISGFAMGWIVAGSAIGPYFFSLSNHLTGSYDPAVVGCMAAAGLLIAAAFRAREDETCDSSGPPPPPLP